MNIHLLLKLVPYVSLLLCLSLNAQVGCPSNNNPISELIEDSTNTVEGEIAICPNDGSELPKIFLCGANDSDNLTVNFSNTQTISWEKLDESSCVSAGDDCANKNAGCTWNSVGSGSNYIAGESGKYRILVTYPNGCSERFYFDVFKNPLDPQANVKDIMCGNPGNITVTNMPADYEYQLLDATSGNILVPYSANNGPVFNITSDGLYTVQIRQSGVSGGCVFQLQDLSIQTRNFEVNTIVSDASCGDFGSINVSVLDAEPQYYYTLRESGSLVDDYVPTSDSNYTFEGLRGGTYELEVQTEEGCTYTELLNIESSSSFEIDAVVSQHITCREGNIQMQTQGNPKGGVSYAIWNQEDIDGNTILSYNSFNDIPASEFQTSVIFDILDEGRYTFVGVDKANCAVVTNTVIIELFPEVDYTTTTADESCYGAADGEIRYTIIDSNGFSVRYRITYPDGSTSENDSGIFTGLAQGDYTVTLIQSKGGGECEFPEDFTIGGPATGISGDVVITQPYTCTQDATIEFQNTIGGTGPYEYSIDGITYGPSNTFPGLTNGTYTITVRDNNGCAFNSDSVTISPLDLPSDITFTTTPLSCPAETSDVTLAVTGGSGAFTYEIIAPAAAVVNNGNNNEFYGLAPDTYTFKVTDANGCEYQENLTINPLIPIQVSGALVSDVSCVGGSDGAIDFAINGFSGTYSYTLNGGATVAGQSSGILNFTGLAAGNYTLVVTDETTNCIDSDTVTVSEPTNTLAFTYNLSPLTCVSDGSVAINATDGWGGYSYQLTQPDATDLGPQGTNVFNGLTQAGTYTIMVTDAGGCAITDTFDITTPVNPAVSLDATTDLCYNPSTGVSLTATPTGGVAPYSFSLNGGPGQNNNVFDSLAPGNYTVTVTDAYGCTGTSGITVVAPQMEVTGVLTKQLDCSASPDALIDISITDGYAPFTYEVNGGASNPIAGNSFTYNTAVDGSFTFTITDSEGCTAQTTVLVDAISSPTATTNITDPTCNGAADGIIEIVIDTNFGTGPYQVDFNGSGLSSQTVYSGLVSGTYNYTIVDDRGCTFSDSVTLTAPNAISADAVITQPYNCLQTATIQVQNVSGGSPGYTYSIDGVSFGASDTFTGVTEGTYNVFVRDTNGCVFTSAPVTIPALDPPTDISFAATAPNCPTQTSDVTLTVTDGVGAITYEIIAPAAAVLDNGNNNVFTALAPDTYTFRVTDANNCSYEESFTITPVDPIAINGTLIRNVSCVGTSDGSVDFNVTGFSATYAYTVNGGAATTGQSSGTISLPALPAGDHTIVVTDETTNCTDSATVTVSEPSVPLNFTFVLTPLTCEVDATVTINAQDGWPQYTYEIVEPDANVLGPQPGNFFSGLNKIGTHTIRVTDSGGCTVTDTFEIISPSNPTASIDPGSALCYSSTTPASIVVGATGGIAPYYYQINGGPTRTSNTFNDLIPGNYTFTVRDSNGCTDDVSITIEPELIATAILSKDLDCSASPDAIIDLNFSGGYSPYTYEVRYNGGAYAAICDCFPYTTSNPGTYEFRITDSQGCVAESNVITVTTATMPVATTTLTDPTCNGDTNGIVEIEIDPNFGTAPYQVSFNGSAFTNQSVYTGLPAGNYPYTVVDSKGCSYSDTATLTDPVLFDATVSVTDVSCGATGDIPGQIDINIISGGVANFTYTLYDNQNNVVPTTGPNPIVNTTATTASFGGLDFGDYYVRIIDANGCEYYKNPVRVLSNPFLTLKSAPAVVDCNTGGTVELLASGGSGDYSFEIYGAGTLPSTEVAGPGVNEETATFTGLNPGQTYVFKAVDNSNLCTSYVEVDIPTVSSIDVVSSPTVTDASCFGDTNGSISFQVEGFDPTVTDIDYSILQAVSNTPLGAAYSGTVTQPGGGPTPTPLETISNIPPGDYILLFKEATSPFCSNTFEFRILEPSPLSMVLIDQNNANCNEEAQVTVRAQGGTGPYTYAFVEDGSAPGAGDYTSNSYAELDPSINTQWDVYAQDANGCVTTVLDVTIAADPSPVIDAFVANQCSVPEGDFTITIDLATAGMAPHTLSINGGAHQAVPLTNTGDSFDLTGLSSGDYDLVIRDANGCEFIHPSITIYRPSSLSAEATVQPTCALNDGQILITPYGGSGAYTYELFQGGVSVTGAPQAMPLFTGLAPGNYVAFIYDTLVAGCGASVSIELEVPTSVSFTTTQNNVSCSGASDGNITAILDPGNNNPPYTYQLLDNLGLPITLPQSNNTFSNLAAADYEVVVRSSRGCEFRQNVTITEPDVVVATAANTEFTCNPDNTVSQATITVSGIGGTGSYMYSIDGANYFSSNIFNINDNGAVQNFTLWVRDDNGCADDVDISINPLPEISSVNVSQLTAITCANDETARVTVTDGSGDFDFDLLPMGSAPTQSPGAGTYTADFNLTAPGDYTFRVTDNVTGCYFVTTPYTVAPFDTIEVNATAISPVSCFGDTDGVMEISVNGYAGNYTYQVFNSAAAAVTGVITADTSVNPRTINNLPGGNFYVEVIATDTPFCDDQSNTITIGSPDAALTLTEITNVNANCNIGAQVAVSASGGNPGYTYSFVPAGNPPGVFTASASTELTPAAYPADYDVYVQDTKGCGTMITITVDEDPVPSVIAPAYAVEQCTSDGTNYTFTVTGTGKAPLEYSLGSGYQPGTTFTVNAPGSYTVTVRDANGCTATDTITILPPLGLTPMASIQPSCALNDGEITVTASGGSGNYEYELFDSAMNPVAPRQPGNLFNSLAPGNYIAVLYDTSGTGCDVQAPVNLETPTPVVFTYTQEDVSCTGGADGVIQVFLDATNNNPSYTFTIDDGVSSVTQTSSLFTGLSAGSYDITVTSGRNCSDTQTVIIAEPAALVATATATAFACNPDNSVAQVILTAGATDGTAPYTYSIDGINFVSNNTFTINDTGSTQNIIVTVKDDNGCTDTASVTIDPLNTFTATVSQTTAITCANPESVLITVNDDGNPANVYTYELLPAGNPDGSNTGYPTNSTASFDLSAVGSYVFRITDTNTGCAYVTEPYNVAPFDLIEVEASQATPVSCFGDNDGTIEFEVQGYNGAFNFEIYQNSGVTTGISGNGNTSTGPLQITGLTGGNYYILVDATDTPYCSTLSNTLNITAPSSPLSSTASETASVQCTNDRGEILVAPDGGYAPYDLVLTNTGTGQVYTAADVGNYIFSGLSSGNYTIQVTDSGGCVISDAITLLQPNPINADISATPATLSCFDDNNGTVTATNITGGQGSYLYSLNYYDASGSTIEISSGAQTSPSFQNLGEGIYSITVTDGWNCVTETA
ncbi:hypothetical protein, partial [Zeaxanthinibacter enoshimensis]|uniref:hypothetical protein n=1 Tax=Zeaxanthinibacter enoshimensis TaxID=392009 RepID=UPI003562A206